MIKNLVIKFGEFLGQGYTHNNVGVVSSETLLWIYTWIGCIDLEAQWKGKTQVIEWLFDWLRQVDF